MFNIWCSYRYQGLLIFPVLLFYSLLYLGFPVYSCSEKVCVLFLFSYNALSLYWWLVGVVISGGVEAFYNILNNLAF